MKYGKKQTIGENLLYGMVWAAIILVPILNSKMMSELHVSIENILTAWRKIAPYLIIFIIHNGFIAPKLLLRHRYGGYLLVNVAVVTAVFTGVELYEHYLVDPFTAGSEAEHYVVSRKASITDLAMYWNVLLGIFMTGANAGIKLIYQSMRDEQEMEALKRQNLQAEMDYLKYQINPHFFMNTLNNIHALIDIDTESAKEAVIELSKMMRYVLYDSGRESITLDRDLQFIENYIELMRIRYTDAVEIRIDRPDPMPPGVSIPPLLLIVFVENAFKHGVSYNRPSFIHIHIEYRNRSVICTIVNSRPRQTDRKSGGIGLENVHKRLELIYGSNFSLQTDDTEPDLYRIKLVIPALNA